MRKKTEGGFIAITSVLIIGAVILVLGVSLFHSALTDYSISSAYESGQEASFLADFCLKEGVLRLKENIDYMGAEDIEVDDTTCYISLVENIDDNTKKKVSSLGRAGDQPHFSRSSQLIRYIIEPGEGGWTEGEESENLILGDSLKLQSAEIIVIPNSASEKSCATLCDEETSYPCKNVGTDQEAASDGQMWTVFEEDGEYSCLLIEEATCESIMSDYSQELPEGCDGQIPDWTYCRCEQEVVGGYRISPEFDISGPDTVKDSRIFWQADERFNGTIKIEVKVFDGAEWGEWKQVTNGAEIPGLEAGTSLSEVKIQTKTSFVGGPDFYPSLKNIKIFIELE